MPITLPALLLACATATVQKGATTVTLKSMHIAGPVVGSEPAIGRVDLTAAPAAPTVISFSSSNPGTVPPPANLVIPGGQTWADFAIKTLPVAAETSVTLTAHSGATSEAKAAPSRSFRRRSTCSIANQSHSPADRTPHAKRG